MYLLGNLFELCVYTVLLRDTKNVFFSCSGFWDAGCGHSAATQRDAEKRRHVKTILLRKLLAQRDVLSENTALSPRVKVGAEQKPPPRSSEHCSAAEES